MRQRAIGASIGLGVLCLLVLVGATGVSGMVDLGAAPSGGSGSHTQETFVQSCTESPRRAYEDPANETGVIGWAGGYWYNEPLNIDTDDGLTQEEVTRLAARTTARYEALRCLNAPDGPPAVTVISREEFKQEQSALFENVSRDRRLFENTKFETTFLVSSEENTIDEQEQNRGATVGGTYNFYTDEITIVSDTPDSLLIDEEVLAHEVGHAIQDQQFDLSQYKRPTIDIDKGVLGLIEGDVSLVEYRYLQACEKNRWDDPCITQESEDDGGDGGGGLSNWGLYFMNFQPYSDGPSFVEYVYESRGGWDAVNELYDSPPTSALPIVYPEQYGKIERKNVSVPDTSSDRWTRLTFENDTDYETFGVAGIAAMFKAPTYNENNSQIWDRSTFLNLNGRRVDDFDPLEYGHPETAGWRDDKLYVYATAENETGAVWKLAWNSATDKEPFLESYEELIELYDGETVENHSQTYTFNSDSRFDMSLRIVPNNDTVTIVMAPTVEALSAVHDVERASAILENDSFETTPTPSPADTASTPKPTETPEDTDSTASPENTERTATPAEPTSTMAPTTAQTPTQVQTPTETATARATAEADGTGATANATGNNTDGGGTGFGIGFGVIVVLVAGLLAARYVSASETGRDQ